MPGVLQVYGPPLAVAGRDRERLIDWGLLFSALRSARQAASSMVSLTRSSREQRGDRLFAELLLREIDRKADRAELLLSGIVEYIKAAAPVEAPVSLGFLVRDALERNAHRISAKGVRLSVGCDDTELHVSIPEEQLRHVLDGVLRIGLDLAPPFGTVEISAAGPGPGTTAPVATDGATGAVASIDIAVENARRWIGGTQNAPDLVPTGRALPQEPEIRLLGELIGFYGGRLSAVFEPAEGKAVVSLLLPVSLPGDSLRD